MGAYTQVYVDLAFQGRLRRSDERYQAEIVFLKEQIEKYGDAVFRVPSYCIVESVSLDSAHRVDWLTILLKTRDTWTRLYVEVREPGVLVLYDRRRV